MGLCPTVRRVLSWIPTQRPFWGGAWSTFSEEVLEAPASPGSGRAVFTVDGCLLPPCPLLCRAQVRG